MLSWQIYFRFFVYLFLIFVFFVLFCLAKGHYDGFPKVANTQIVSVRTVGRLEQVSPKLLLIASESEASPPLALLLFRRT